MQEKCASVCVGVLTSGTWLYEFRTIRASGFTFPRALPTENTERAVHYFSCSCNGDQQEKGIESMITDRRLFLDYLRAHAEINILYIKPMITFHKLKPLQRLFPHFQLLLCD